MFIGPRHRDTDAGHAAPPLSIGYVLAAFPVLSETFVSNEIRAMRRLGHRILPIALARYDGTCQPEDAGFLAEAVQLDSIDKIGALKALPGRPGALADAIRFARAQKSLEALPLLWAGARVAHAAHRAGCTHLHAHFAHCAAATALVAGRLAGMTVSFTAHGYDVYGAPADLAVKLAEADLAIATCSDMAADFRRLAPAGNVRIVHCGTDPDRFRPLFGGVSAAARNGRLLAVGRLVEQKGYEVLLDALAALPGAIRPQVDVVGTGPLADALIARACSLGIAANVNFLGARPSGWIAEHGPHYLGLLAPNVFCRSGDRDSSPVVAKEALAMQLPVVASALMGLKEIVTPGCGRLVPPGEVAPLAEAIAWLAGLDEATRQAMGAAGRMRILEKFTIAGQASALAAGIAEIRSVRWSR